MSVLPSSVLVLGKGDVWASTTRAASGCQAPQGAQRTGLAVGAVASGPGETWDPIQRGPGDR